MKNILLWTAGLLLMSSSCTKKIAIPCETKAHDFSGNDIRGVWRHSSSYYSTGGPIINNRGSKKLLQLNSDGTVCGDYFDEQPVVSYELKVFNPQSTRPDSVIIFSKPDHTTIEYRYYLRENGNQLSFGPYPVVCIEGCGTAFTRVN
ncbi:hypothetical protein ABDK00_002605 [Niabella insulamsoli]|uniref:hypothetical protein n=1 Tax=Niabella insulamsoli TaxID=3144874 RepID=UPI0031FCF763